MRCRLSGWVKRPGGQRCRALTCSGRKLAEYVSHEWWKEMTIPRGTRASDVCGRGCKEETIVVTPSGRVRRLRTGGKGRRRER